MRMRGLPRTIRASTEAARDVGYPADSVEVTSRISPSSNHAVVASSNSKRRWLSNIACLNATRVCLWLSLSAAMGVARLSS